MKLNAYFLMATLGCVLTAAPAIADTGAAAQKTLVCELKDLALDRVMDRGSETLDHSHILFLVGGTHIMGTVRDVSQAESGDRYLQLQLAYRSGVESSISHAETTYIAESAPLNATLAETSIELGQSERRFQLRCFLQ